MSTSATPNANKEPKTPDSTDDELPTNTQSATDGCPRFRIEMKSDKPLNMTQIIRWTILCYYITGQVASSCVSIHGECARSIGAVFTGAMQYMLLCFLGNLVDVCRANTVLYCVGTIALTLFTVYINRPWNNWIYLSLLILDVTNGMWKVFQKLILKSSIDETWRLELDLNWLGRKGWSWNEDKIPS
ncbi:hypothetical protein H072_6020 [Dactylellina haptotyla CBS 200.50]|uniref:Uncharacterized protein n=1 Tax=Dactylellina haptotyla (strain CBS 200.50) TaxID=1284197 RepID=S8AB40_DACHA|nr:hypothetical protein H072_6020 [Dactylellina haptotyla CBS 200.50]